MSLIKQILGFIGLLAVAGLSMGDITDFINIPSFVIVAGMTICALLYSNVERGTAEFWRQARVYAMGSGCFGALIALVLILSTMDDPTRLGPAIALSILTLLYAVFFGYFIALPMENRKRNE